MIIEMKQSLETKAIFYVFCRGKKK